MSNALEILKQGTFIPAVPLVLDENKKFDEAGQRLLLRYYLAAGVGGLAVAVHTTQFEIRDKDIALFEPVLRVTKEEVDAFEAKTGKTIVLVAGACGPTEQAVEEAKTAKQLGYHAMLLSPGGLNDRPEAYLVDRTKAVAQEMPVIGFYLQPSVGGRTLSFEYWEQVTEIENVVAIKAAPFNRYLTLDVARAVAFSSRKEQITLYTGNDDSIVTDLLTDYSFEKDGEAKKVRFIGGLLGHWCVWTHTAVQYYEKTKKAADTGNITPELITLAAQVTDANCAFFDPKNDFLGCIVGIHEVLRRQGLMKYIHTLNPKEYLSEEQSKEIDRVYKMYPHLNDDAFVAAFLKGQ